MIVDTNVHLFRWPFRRLTYDETPKLVAKLKKAGVAQAWAGSFEGLLHRDVAGVNERLSEECRQHGDGLLLPYGCVNPMLPDWQDDLRRCHKVHGMRGIRLHPNYHGYKLDLPAFAELLALAEKRGLIVQLAVKMEDERTQHPLVQVPEVDTQPLAELLKQRPRLQMVILNGLRTLRGPQLAALVNAGNVYVEIAMQEGVGGIDRLIKQLPFERVLFGSHFPFFYLEAALLKLKESEPGEFIQQAITHRNAERLMMTAAAGK